MTIEVRNKITWIVPESSLPPGGIELPRLRSVLKAGVLRLHNCFASRNSYSAQDDSLLLIP